MLRRSGLNTTVTLQFLTRTSRNRFVGVTVQDLYTSSTVGTVGNTGMSRKFKAQIATVCDLYRKYYSKEDVDVVRCVHFDHC